MTDLVSFDSENEYSVEEETEDWGSAVWLNADPGNPSSLFKLVFEVRSTIRRASLNICGLGMYEAYINGGKIDDSVLSPMQTNYDDYAFFQSYDLTPHLHEGSNAIAAWTGPGWFDQESVWGGLTYGKQGLIACLKIEYADGMIEHVQTGENWSCRPSAITRANVYSGERFDAQSHDPQWAFASSGVYGWSKVMVSPQPLTPKMISTSCRPIRKIEECMVERILEPTPSVRVFDFGQNMSGWVRLLVKAAAGVEVCLRFSESIFPDGSIDPLSTGVTYTHCIQTDRYVCSGDGDEVWEPRFACHGFRYVEVTASSPILDAVSLIGIVVHSDLIKRGEVEVSDPLLAKVYEMAAWTLRSNLHGFISDCPARERCGWLGDAHVVAEFLSFQYWATEFLDKVMQDILGTFGKAEGTWDGSNIDARLPANIAPGKRYCLQARPDWGVAVVSLTFNIWLFSGDRQVIQKYSQSMNDWIQATWETSNECLITDGFGDWCPPGSVEPLETSPEFTSSVLFFRALGQMANMMLAIGCKDEAYEYNALKLRVGEAINSKYLTSGGYGSQTANAMALCYELVPDERVSDALNDLVHNVQEKHRGHFACGIFGMSCLFEALIDSGREDLVWEIFNKTGFPSFTHLIDQEATTFWEMFYDPEMHPNLLDRSKNHPMQAAFAKFYYSHIAGIRPVPDSPGFSTFILRPSLMTQIVEMDVSVATKFGLIRSKWVHQNEGILWEFVVPEGTEALVYLPPSLRVQMSAEVVDGATVGCGLYSILFSN